MWIITSINTGEVFHLLKEKLKYVVGRAGADIILKDDTSISRAHAILQLEIDANQVLSVVLIDTDSKYGTYHNEGIASNTKINPNTPVQLNDGDKIRFGLLKNEWKLTKFNIKCMSSALSTDAAKTLEHYIHNLGGSIIPKWESGCTHLTMEELNITVKVLYALLNDIPIVTCDYWKDVLNSARKNIVGLPRAKNYLPRKGVLFMDKTELDYTFRPERNTLFTGKTFVFMHKTHSDTYGPLVQQAGGTITDLNSGVQKTFLIKENVVVIQYVPSTQSQSSQTINSINELLQSNNKRIIPEYEIGLAIVLLSVEKYCNPDNKELSELMPSTEPTSFSENMRVGDTQSVSASELEIPETGQTITTNSSETGTDDAMPNIAVSPSMNSESESKRKRPADSNHNDEDSDDDFSGYFSHPAKKPNLQAHIKPLPIVIQKKNTVNVWLNKTQPEPSQRVEDASIAERQPPQGIKRGRIAVINDGDSGDESDLFNFGSSGSATDAKKMRFENDADRNTLDSDEDLFDFQKKSTEKANTENSTSEALEPTEVFVSKEKPQSNGVVETTIKRKIIPEKVSTEGWLCCSFNQMNVEQVKSEIKTEITDEDISPEHKQYIDALKGAFEVRIGAIKICSKENVSNCNASSLSNGVTNGTTKNFKPFVKKCNYLPQNKVITVVRVPVDPLRRI